MAQGTNKNKESDNQDQKDKEEKRKDAGALIDLSNEFLAGRYDEDSYIDATMAIASKLGKNKKPKKVKEKQDMVLASTNKLTDFQISYLKNVVQQVFKDTGLKIKTNL